MDFKKFAEQQSEDIINPYAAKTSTGEWIEGVISIDFLQEHFGHFESLEECIQATESEGLKLFFEYLKAQQ